MFGASTARLHLQGYCWQCSLLMYWCKMLQLSLVVNKSISSLWRTCNVKVDTSTTANKNCISQLVGCLSQIFNLFWCLERERFNLLALLRHKGKNGS